MNPEVTYMQSAVISASLPYHEPAILTIVIQSSLLLLLNAVNSLLNTFLYCGLIGQILLGIAWGSPGAKWLDSGVEQAMVQLGYLGLLLIVYEGGLLTSLKLLRLNIWLSLAVAMTGVGLPIGLSFVLRRLTDATAIQCFAAGASLCSTSLGTTFTVLQTSGLTTSKIGAVLSSAAMMDDVVGLILVQVISNIGQSGTTVSASTAVRPLLVSLAFAAAAPLLCIFVLKPLTTCFSSLRIRNRGGLLNFLNFILEFDGTIFLVHSLILLGSVTAATYAGTSNLFAAYLAGASISWWDSEDGCLSTQKRHDVNTAADADAETRRVTTGPLTDPVRDTNQTKKKFSGLQLYQKYYSSPVERVLKPFFFASIGFSIPVTKMFSSSIVWKGLIYSMIMIVAKLACGIWILGLSFRLPLSMKLGHHFMNRARSTGKRLCSAKLKSLASQLSGGIHGQGKNDSAPNSMSTADQAGRSASAPPALERRNAAEDRNDTASDKTNPRSLYPAFIVGCAMVSRGEIGFLISSIAEGNAIFGSDESANSDLFLIVTWAIVICTLIGPLAAGMLVQRVKKLQHGVEREGRVVHRNVLGAWGLS